MCKTPVCLWMGKVRGTHILSRFAAEMALSRGDPKHKSGLYRNHNYKYSKLFNTVTNTRKENSFCQSRMMSKTRQP